MNTHTDNHDYDIVDAMFDFDQDFDAGWTNFDIALAEQEQYAIELEAQVRFPSVSVEMGVLLLELEHSLSFLNLRNNILLNPKFDEVPF